MSNKETDRTITIGMKYSEKQFIIKEKEFSPEKISTFLNDLEDAMNGKKDGVDIYGKDYLYFSIDSIAYMFIEVN
ncbi:hypothetical protein DWB95_12050 (plasmid) [Staphylococcus pasteuri]|uniref:hypothetical protein n=1 Tax=Staphylococcus pasteuri TaxID=45972 RepID=UPI00118A463E|nr:hypothetical protein [Staphylococcus pasteuri]QDW85658.1 hypothetical protein DWB95_12050 [Staphylococcus pasteuri]